MSTFVLFGILSVLTIFSALMVILSKNPVNSAIFLILTFCLISGHYLLLNAQFLAVVNIIVYAGAIMVLFLFVIMLMNLNKTSERTVTFWLKLISFISGGSLLVLITYAIKDTQFAYHEVSFFDNSIGLIRNLGYTLFNNYVIPFEISSILFLSAMISVVIIGKKEDNIEKQDFFNFHS